MQIFILKFFLVIFYHLLLETFLLHIDLCRIMILSTRPKKLGDSMQQMALTGGNPPESPDMNPIENLWHELKEFLRREVKPMNKQQLIDGIKQFWATIDVVKCCCYIKHLDKVVPHVIECCGSATGY